MEEVRGIPFEEKVLPKISKMIIEHLVNYFQKKIDQGLIRDIDPEVAALNIFSIVFQMDIVWKIYEQKRCTPGSIGQLPRAGGTWARWFQHRVPR